MGSRERVRSSAAARWAAAAAARWAAAAAAVTAAAALGACKPEPEPLFSATCAPDPAMEQVTCTIRNQGKKEGRACLRARVWLESGESLTARRVCTKVLAPEQSAEVAALFERIGRLEGPELLQSQCAPNGQWTCKVDVVETSREMMENQPKSR